MREDPQKELGLGEVAAPRPAKPADGPRPAVPAEKAEAPTPAADNSAAASASASSVPATKEPPLHAGHRERLRHRFRQAGADAFADYELLELLLFRIIPRQDTKPIAKRLMARFGSLAEVLSAPAHLLCEVDGVGETIALELKIVRAAGLRMARVETRRRPVLASWQNVLDYCHAAMAYDTHEQFSIIFLDKKNQVICDEVQQRGTVDHTPVYVREVVRRALELSATAIILVHNHPSGDPKPSRADIEMTRRIIEAAQTIGIAVHDHIIIGRNGHASLKSLGHI